MDCLSHRVGRSAWMSICRCFNGENRPIEYNQMRVASVCPRLDIDCELIEHVHTVVGSYFDRFRLGDWHKSSHRLYHRSGSSWFARLIDLVGANDSLARNGSCVRWWCIYAMAIGRLGWHHFHNCSGHFDSHVCTWVTSLACCQRTHRRRWTFTEIPLQKLSTTRSRCMSSIWLLSETKFVSNFSLWFYYQTQSLAELHLSTLQREQEARFRKNLRNCSQANFAPMQSEGFRNSKWAGLFRPTGYKPMILLFFFFLIQQFSGIYITLFYAVTFLEVRMSTRKMHNPQFTNEILFQLQDIGTKVNPYQASIFVGVTRFIMSLINAWLLKRFKRRPLIMASTIGMTLCMGISGTFTKLIKDGNLFL